MERLHIIALLVFATICNLQYSTATVCVYSCVGKINGNYQHCPDCRKYVACSNGYKYIMPCPANLVWDDNMKRCEWTSSTCPESTTARPTVSELPKGTDTPRSIRTTRPIHTTRTTARTTTPRTTTFRTTTTASTICGTDKCSTSPTITTPTVTTITTTPTTTTSTITTPMTTTLETTTPKELPKGIDTPRSIRTTRPSTIRTTRTTARTTRPRTTTFRTTTTASTICGTDKCSTSPTIATPTVTTIMTTPTTTTSTITTPMTTILETTTPKELPTGTDTPKSIRTTRPSTIRTTRTTARTTTPRTTTFRTTTTASTTCGTDKCSTSPTITTPMTTTLATTTPNECHIPPPTDCCIRKQMRISLEDHVPVVFGKVPYVSVMELTNGKDSCGCDAKILLNATFQKNRRGDPCQSCTNVPECGNKMLRIDLEMAPNTTGFSFHVGDSRTNNGYKGDASTQENDAEFHFLGYQHLLYGSDKCPDMSLIMTGLLSNITTSITIFIGNEFIRVSNNLGYVYELCSECLFSLNGQSDSQGPVNEDIFISLNRIIDSSSYREGTGICSAVISWACPWNCLI